MRVLAWGDAARLGILGSVGFLTALGAHIIAVGLPDYSRAHGLGFIAIGVLLAAYNLAEIIIKPLAGRAADRMGPRLVMAWGTGLFSLSCLAWLGLPGTVLPALRVCQGLGAGALSVSSMILVARLFPGDLGAAFGIYHALKGLGYVCAPAVGGLLGEGLRGAFLAAGLAGLAVLAFQLAAGRRLEARRAAPAVAGRKTGRTWPWYVANFVDMALFGALTGFLPIRADRLGHGGRGIGLILAGAMAAFLIAQPLAGRLADRVGRRAIALMGLAAGAAGVSLLGVANGSWLAWTGILAGGGLGAAWANSLAVVGESAESRRIGADLGLAGSCKDAGDMAGPLFLGYLAGAFGLSAAFAICGGLGLLAAAAVAAASRDGFAAPRRRGS